jgi:hypothetical protein
MECCRRLEMQAKSTSRYFHVQILDMPLKNTRFEMECNGKSMKSKVCCGWGVPRPDTSPVNKAVFASVMAPPTPTAPNITFDSTLATHLASCGRAILPEDEHENGVRCSTFSTQRAKLAKRRCDEAAIVNCAGVCSTAGVCECCWTVKCAFSPPPVHEPMHGSTGSCCMGAQCSRGWTRR